MITNRYVLYNTITRDHETTTKCPSLTLASYNIWSVTNNISKLSVFLESGGLAYFICLQETWVEKLIGSLFNTIPN